MTDKEIQRTVLEELDWEPLVSSTQVGVSVADGVVTLSGIVDTFSQQYHAERAAKRVRGVRAVANDLEVKLAARGKRSDPDIAWTAAQALEHRTTVPPERVQVTVHEGWVTLEGNVDWNYQKEAAESVVRYLHGMKGVSNLIQVKPPLTPAEMKGKIEAALRRNARIDATGIEVETTGSTAILRGSVCSWSEREEAERTAWRTPGMAKVENHIAVMV